MVKQTEKPFNLLLRQYRKQVEFTQQQLGYRTGYSRDMVSRWESRTRPANPPNRDVVLKIANTLSLNMLETNRLLNSAGYASLPVTDDDRREIFDISDNKQSRNVDNNKVFLVHGHDEGTKAKVARLLEKLGLEVVILHEKTNDGLTIIEKFEKYSDVGFAVVLLTGDDKGGTKDTPYDDQKLRARQNVILELGYFVGKLKRDRVRVLYGEGVEIPSDFSGVVYTPLSSHRWDFDLAKELKNAGYDVDLHDV